MQKLLQFESCSPSPITVEYGVTETYSKDVLCGSVRNAPFHCLP